MAGAHEAAVVLGAVCLGGGSLIMLIVVGLWLADLLGLDELVGVAAAAMVFGLGLLAIAQAIL